MGTMNRKAFEEQIEFYVENVKREMTPCLFTDQIIQILRRSPKHEYECANSHDALVAALRKLIGNYTDFIEAVKPYTDVVGWQDYADEAQAALQQAGSHE